jgi:hypothetical protein
MMDVPPATTPPAVVAPSPTPAPTLMPLTWVVTPPPPAAGGPAITQIAMSDRAVHSNAPYVVVVTTTLDVTGVTVEALGSSFALFPAGPGRFGVMGQTPSIPFFFAGRTINARVVASGADGRTYATTLPIRIDR